MHANTAASTNTEQTCLHPTTDSSLRPIVDGCQHIPLFDQWVRLLLCHHNKHRSRFRMSRTGPKTTPIHDSNIGPKSTPTNHGTCQRERQRAAFATRKDTSASKKKIFRTRLRAESSNFQTTFLKNFTKVKTDVENCRLLQHTLLCKALSKCLHSSRSKCQECRQRT